MQISFTSSARDQFLGAVAYIHRQNPKAARRFKSTAEKSLNRLKAFPNSGRFIPEFPNLPHREVIVPPYRFFYRVIGQRIWIVAVWRDSQLPAEPQLSE